MTREEMLDEAELNFNDKEMAVIEVSQKLAAANAEVRRLREAEKKALGALYNASEKILRLKKEIENA